MPGMRDWLSIAIGRRNSRAPREAAVCYRYGNSLFLCASCVTDAGFGFDSEPYRLLSPNLPDDELGAIILEVLAESKRIIPAPDRDRMRHARTQLLRAAGLSSERKLQQKAICCTITRDGQELRFTPSHNGGTRGDKKGFHHMNDALLTIPANGPPARAAETLRETLRRCTSVFASPTA
jgi:hypothetical protein